MRRLAGAAGSVLALAALGAAAAIRCGETGLVVTEHVVPVAGLPPALGGTRIVQLSDLHDTRFGADDAALLAAVDAARPDVIALTGDILDRGTVDLTGLRALAVRLLERAPVLAVTGNHEGGTVLGPALMTDLAHLGVRVLRDEVIDLALRAGTLRVAGIDDPRVHGGPPSSLRSPEIDRALACRALERAGLPQIPTSGDAAPRAAEAAAIILLAHRPELLDVYAGRGIGVVLSGHAHGGQWRPPGTQGVYAPNQGPLPRRTAGVHAAGSTRMVVSRGLKLRRTLPRLGNPPEVVAVELRRP